MRSRLVVASVLLALVACTNATTVASDTKNATETIKPGAKNIENNSTADVLPTSASAIDTVVIKEELDSESSSPADSSDSKTDSSSATESSPIAEEAESGREGRELDTYSDASDQTFTFDEDYPEESADAESDDDSELTEEERLQILEELRQLNSTELEQLPQPEMFISHVRNYWRRQEESQKRIRNEILDMIVPRKKVSWPRSGGEGFDFNRT